MIVQVTKPNPPQLQIQTIGIQGPAGPPGPPGNPAILVPQPVKTIAIASYTVVEADDAWHLIVCDTSAAAVEVRLPGNGITPGIHFDFVRKGANDLSLYTPTGMLNGKTGAARIKVRADYSAVGAMLMVSGEWLLVGDLA